MAKNDHFKARLKKKLKLKKKAQKALDDLEKEAADIRNEMQSNAERDSADAQAAFTKAREELQRIQDLWRSRLAQEMEPLRERAVKVAKVLDKTDTQIETLREIIRGEVPEDEGDLDAQLAKLNKDDPEESLSADGDDGDTPPQTEPDASADQDEEAEIIEIIGIPDEDDDDISEEELMGAPAPA